MPSEHDKEFHRRVMTLLANKRQCKRRAAIKFAKEMGWTIIDSKSRVLVMNPKWSSNG